MATTQETISNGPRYIITTDGQTAEKSDGNSSRRMKYYPERDAGAIAGEIDETTAWTLLRDIAVEAGKTHVPICPEHILISGDNFILSEWSESTDPRFMAPEGHDPVWALAAATFYIFLGTYPFQGLGGKGQTATAPVPTLRRQLPELSSLIARALSFDKTKRPTLNEIAQTAEANLTRCRNSATEFPPLKNTAKPTDYEEYDQLWPDKIE